MYGHIHVCLKSMVLEQYGTEVWNTILRKAGGDDTSDFMQFQQYPDVLTERLLAATIDVSGLDRPTILERYGEYFYHYVNRLGYSNMLRTLGEDYVSFLKHLDFLHILLATTYEGMIPPHFRCEEVDGKIFLHFYSKRGRGLYKIAVGLAREVGIQLFGVDVETRLLSVEALNGHPEGFKEYALIEIITNGPRKNPDGTPSKTSLSELECPMTASGDNVSNLVLSHCSFRSAAPYHVIVDENLTIRGSGNGFKKILNHSETSGNKLTDCFNLVDPVIDFCYEQIVLHLNKTFTLVTKTVSSNGQTANLTFKGQFIKMEDSSDLTYMGSPYFSSLHELTNQNTCLTNFPKDDIVRELFFIREKAKAEVQISKLLDSSTAQLQKMSRALEKEKARTDELLNEMLPTKVADQLRQGKRVEAEKFEEATVLFSDIVTFTRMAAECEPMQIVAVLNELFQKFDELTSVHDVYKVETIGDAYMVVSGVPEVITEHAMRIARVALDMVLTAKQVFRPNTDRPIQIRVGMHTGPVVAGVVGQKMPRYCLFGDTVNTASRMESHGLPNHVHLTQTTYQQLQGNGLVFTARGLTQIKGKGKMFTYFLLGYQRNHLTLAQNKVQHSKHYPGESDLVLPQSKTKVKHKSTVCVVL